MRTEHSEKRKDRGILTSLVSDSSCDRIVKIDHDSSGDRLSGCPAILSFSILEQYKGCGSAIWGG